MTAQAEARRFDELYEGLERSYFGDQPNEAPIIALLPRALAGCEVFVDVGASLGVYAYHANRILKGRTIFAIEADPVRYQRLVQNCKSWQTEGTNRIIAVNAAIADEDGEIDISISDSVTSGGIAPTPSASVEWRTVRVPMRSLDSVLGDTEGRVFIKMDIEGAEYLALSGAPRLMASRPDILLEVHAWGDPKFQKQSWDVLEMLADQGYGARHLMGRYLLSVREELGGSRKALRGYARQLRLRGSMRPLKRLVRWFAGAAKK